MHLCLCYKYMFAVRGLLTYSRNVSALLCVLILMFGFVLFQVRRWEIYASWYPDSKYKHVYLAGRFSCSWRSLVLLINTFLIFSLLKDLTSHVYTFVPALKMYNLITKKYGVQEISYLIVLSCYILIEIFVYIAICYCDMGETILAINQLNAQILLL